MYGPLCCVRRPTYVMESLIVGSALCLRGSSLTFLQPGQMKNCNILTQRIIELFIKVYWSGNPNNNWQEL